MSLLIILGIVVLLGFILAGVYNRLISSRNHVDEAWSDIEVQLKRRYDLIPNLIETVKGYAKHEKETLDAVIKARNSAMNAGTVQEKMQDENMLSGALKNLFALSESYPDLKANQNFMSLQNELVDTENKIQAARRYYNGNVREFNTKIQVFPTNLFAGFLGFTARQFFDLPDGSPEAEPVKVQF